MNKKCIFKKKLSKIQKILFLMILLCFLIMVTIGIPTLSRFKNRSSILTQLVWDGSVAEGYKTGTGSIIDPYIISTGSELAYFSSELLNNDYENTYFKLNNDIILNEGIFNYSNGKIEYIINSETYYIENYTNKYYNNASFSGLEIGEINLFDSLDNFKGTFDGNSFAISGLYITDQLKNNLGLFTNLEGNIIDLYVENSMIYGGIISGGIASNANNSNIKNVLFKGNVINRDNNKVIQEQINVSIPDIILENFQKTNYIDLSNNIPFVGSNVISTSITGNYSITHANRNETYAKINNETLSNNTFNIDLGTTILDEIPLITYTDSLDEIKISFSDVVYNVEYEYGVSGGIVGFSKNNVIENCVNKGYINGFSNSGGIIGVTNSKLDIIRSYNNGLIDSANISGGIIGNIEKSSEIVNINQVYNNVDNLFGGIVGYVKNNSGNININNSFNIYGYNINLIQNSIVNITNSYYSEYAVNSGLINGEFILSNISNLKDKSYLTANLNFNEFVDFADVEINQTNSWIFENESFPILFIDDILNPIAKINTNFYSWENLSYTLNPLKTKNNIIFNIQNLIPLKEVYYYIHESDQALTKNEIDEITNWNSYTNKVTISDEGVYIIFAKLVDYNDNIRYLNTDILILDLSDYIGKISLNDNVWSSYKSEIENLYIYDDSDILINEKENFIDISNIEYYISDTILSINDLNQLENWNKYSGKISINEVGNYIIYVKFTDEYDYKYYINTDYIVYKGYNSTLKLGENSNSYNELNNYITNKSKIILNFNYSNFYHSDLIDYTHNIKSNILLPINTEIKIIDKIKNKIYQYKVETDLDLFNYDNSCDLSDLNCEKISTYPFSLFKEIGTDELKAFNESSYYLNNLVNEDFDIVVDFSNTNFSENYTDVKIYLETEQNENKKRTTSEIVKFNILSSVNSESSKAVLSLNTTFDEDIYFNSISTNNINIESKINYKVYNNFKIIDTTFENMNMGLLIKVINSNNEVVDSSYLKSLVFKLNNKNYSFMSDNTIRINLSDALIDKEETLTIITHPNNLLDSGDYVISISNFVSYDGIYFDNIGDTLMIDLKVENKSLIEYGFDVLIDDENRIIKKEESLVNVDFSILQYGLSNPNITVELYKKDELNPFNQNYTSVNLQSFVNTTLNLKNGNVYYVTDNPLEYNELTELYNVFGLDLITSSFDNTGYKFVFTLNDSNEKIGTIEKYFIVR